MKLPRPLAALLFLAFSLMAVAVFFLDVFWVDYNVDVLYLIPAGLALWFLGRWPGYFVAALSYLEFFFRRPQEISSLGVVTWEDLTFVLTMIFVLQSLLAIRKLLNREASLARTDPLTKALNFRAFEELVNQELLKAQRNKTPVTMVSLDCDHFKKVNDTWGHGAGDEVLVVLVKTFQSKIRPGDFLARLGGDEFTLFFPGTTADQVRSHIESMKQEFEKEMVRRGWPVTLSMGGISFTQTPPSLDAAKKACDQVLYQVKETGRNRLLLREEASLAVVESVSHTVDK